MENELQLSCVNQKEQRYHQVEKSVHHMYPNAIGGQGSTYENSDSLKDVFHAIQNFLP